MFKLPILAACLSLVALQALAKTPLRYKTIGNSAGICATVANHLNGGAQNSELDFVYAKKEVPPIGPALPSPLFIRHVDFDFDNDGEPDQVFSYENAGSYIYGTIFYVNRGPLKAHHPAALSIEDLLVFPCQFDTAATASKNCPPLSQNLDEAGTVVKLPGNKKAVFFRGRYTLMEPFLNSGKTYIILRSRSYDTRRYAALIQPTGGTTYKSSCLFERSAR